MDGVMLAWYGWLSGLTQGLVLILQDIADSIGVPAVAVVVFGLIGAASPCQLTTNLGALAYAAARPGGTRAFALTLAYVAGKLTLYTLVGAAAVLAGLQLQAMSIPVVVAARKALGPLMIVVGLVLVGLWRPRFTVGQALTARLHKAVNGRGAASAYLLGLVFAFAFCPTLFWLFFGLTIPLALTSSGGWLFPGLFAVGSSLPLLAVAAVMTGSAAAVEGIGGPIRRLERPVRIASAGVLAVAGFHDTLVYWRL